MTVDDYFVREFKQYLTYKRHILEDGANYVSDQRIGTLLSNLPQNQVMTIDESMRMQYKYLLGQDLGIMPDARGHATPSDIFKHILPNGANILTNKEKLDYCLIKGVTEPYFDKLNRTVVTLQPRIQYHKRVTGTDGTFIKNVDGEDLQRDVDIPVGSRVVLSHISIQLPNFIMDGTRRIPVIPSEGFGYLDYLDTPSGRKYLYYVPRDFIYPMNLNVMVLSTNRLQSRFWWGRKYEFNRGIASAYLYIAPYAQHLFVPSNLVFNMKMSLDYDDDIKKLESFWQTNVGPNGVPRPAILYPIEELRLHNDMGVTDEESSLVYQTLNVPEREPYQPVTESLAAMTAVQEDIEG